MDDEAAREPGKSRSAVIERWLRSARRQQGEASLARDVVAYYRSLTADEREEERALADALGQSTRRALADERTPAKKRRRT